MSIEKGVKRTLHERRKQFYGWLKRMGWNTFEWKADLTFGTEEGYRITYEGARKKVIGWFRELQTKEHIQVAAYFTIARKNGRLHVHAVMVGRGRGGTLLDVSPPRWRRKWPHRARVEFVREQSTARAYVAVQFLKNSYCDMEIYNLKLLETLDLESMSPPDDPTRPVIGCAEAQEELDL